MLNKLCRYRAFHEFKEDERIYFNKIFKKYFNVSFEIHIIDIFCCTTHIPYSISQCIHELCLPPWNGETYCLKLIWLSVRPSLRPSVYLSVCHTFVSALYLLNPSWVLQIILHKCQVWWDDVQCLCLTKFGSRSRSQSKIKHCVTIFRVRFISFEPLVGFTNNFAQMSSMMWQCAVPRFHQGRFKVQATI